MNWFSQLAAQQPVAHAVLVLSVVAVFGLALGSIRYRQLKLGSAGVLFAGIIAGHFGLHVEESIREFTREFGLILFVFTIGLQLGPGFFASLRRQGLRLNALAAFIVLGGGGMVGLAVGWLGVNPFAGLGLFSGATTNTPSLGAAQQALATLPDLPPELRALPALAYAVSYPVGIAGVLGALLGLKLLFRVDVARELENFERAQRRGVEPLERRTLELDNANLAGLAPDQLPGLRETGVVVTRVQSAGGGAVRAATRQESLQRGDRLLVVGTRSGLDQFQRIVGREVATDLTLAPGTLVHRRVVVTREDVLGRTLTEVGLGPLYGVIVSRVSRADLQMTGVPELRLQFGDVLNLVGEGPALDQAAAAVGNSVKALNETQFVPIFIGLALGVLAGLVPLSFPGLPAPARLGLAGGPLIVAILLSRLGHFGGLVWHMPATANFAIRELGITLFLACVGLKAGEQFFATVFTGVGLLWLGSALLITLVPLLAAGIFARLVLRLDFPTLSGLLAGSLTDPPALAFAGSLCRSDAPHVAYATVYPLTMLLRIVMAQVLALLLCR